MMSAVKRSLLASAVLTTLHGAAPGFAEPFALDIRSRPITEFRIGSAETRFGRLEFAGGLEMIGSSQHFGAWSGIKFHGGQTSFVGVADTGFFLTGRVERGANGAPAGISGVAMDEIKDGTGRPIDEKWKADAEGIAISADDVFVSFERAHRISKYRQSPDGSWSLVSESAPPVPLYELRENRGFEGIAFAPPSSPLDGALVGVSEKSLDKAGNIMAFAAPPAGKPFEFSIARTNEFDVTDIAFLPDGDLVLLERGFAFSSGIGMRLRQIPGDSIKAGNTVDGETLLKADLLYQIDNMEGLDITVDPDDTPRMTIVSDDNHSLLQRNLLLEFRLVEPPVGQ